MNKVRWGLIGCGKVVLKNEFTPFINDENEIVSICTTDIDHSIKAIERLKIKNCNAYDDVRMMLKNESIDAIYICTPPKFHYLYLELLSEYDIPIIYVEKPFVLNSYESNKIKNLYQNKETKIFVAHYKRLTPQIQEIKNIIDSCNYGNIIRIEGFFSRIYDESLLANTWLYDKDISGGGRFFDIAPHILDTLYYIFGKFEDIHSSVEYNNLKHDCETNVVINFSINNIPCSLKFNLEDQADLDKLYIYFEDYTLETSINRDLNIYIFNTDKKLVEKKTFDKPKIWGIEAVHEIDKIFNTGIIEINISTLDDANTIQEYIDEILKKNQKKL